MKLIRSVIRPSRFDDVRTALGNANVTAFTVSEIHDYAPQNRHGRVWRGREYSRDDIVRFEVVLLVDDDDADAVVAVILRAARTSGLADGHVAVMPVDHRYTVHSGFREIP
jgi:nitrogen regulatory protein P-II 1